MNLALSTLLALGLLGAPALASAQEDAPAAVPPSAPRYDYVRVGAGVRVGYLPDAGFDAFASNDVLAQLSLEGTYAFYTRGKLAIASGVAWDNGARSSGARGATTRLTMNRLTVPIEARWYVTPWLDVFGRVAPGAGSYLVRVEDPSSSATLRDAPWVFATDLSAGAHVRLAGANDHTVRRARLWLTTELGYGLTTSTSVRPRPDRNEDDVLGSDEGVRLGSLAANGAFWRAGVAVSF
jgi:hypothetical protein